jgi:hypothetical protein
MWRVQPLLWKNWVRVNALSCKRIHATIEELCFLCGPCRRVIKRTRKVVWVIFLIGVVGNGVQLGPLGTAATNRPIVPAPGDYDGETGGMIGKGNRSTRRKPALMPLYPPQTPHAARTRTRAAAMGSQRLTAWATARPIFESRFSKLSSGVVICNRELRVSGVDSWQNNGKK